jgi:hypothetical protein
LSWTYGGPVICTKYLTDWFSIILSHRIPNDTPNRDAVYFAYSRAYYSAFWIPISFANYLANFIT